MSDRRFVFRGSKTELTVITVIAKIAIVTSGTPNAQVLLWAWALRIHDHEIIGPRRWTCFWENGRANPIRYDGFRLSARPRRRYRQYASGGTGPFGTVRFTTRPGRDYAHGARFNAVVVYRCVRDSYGSVPLRYNGVPLGELCSGTRTVRGRSKRRRNRTGRRPRNPSRLKNESERCSTKNVISFEKNCFLS